MKAELIEAADAILAKGHRVLLVPVKDAVRVFDVQQKEVNPQKQNIMPPPKR